MSKLHIKKGDNVYINAGKDKGKTGKVLSVLVEKQRAIVEGCNMMKKSVKPNAKIRKEDLLQLRLLYTSLILILQSMVSL